jgi:nucleoside triphosphate diphosphatase
MSQIERLLETMARLRDPEAGCPWDRQQTFASIVPHTLEEAYEVAEAIERGTQEELRDELGDLLFQVVFYAQLAREAGYFDFEDIIEGIMSKLTRRHPHVFGEQQGITTAEAQTLAWEAHKAAERRTKAKPGAASVLAGISRSLPALTRAIKLQRRAARVGFDWDHIEPVLEKIEEELREVRGALRDRAAAGHLSEEVGDLLFACVNLARFVGVDPEASLRKTNAKFEQRFQAIEAALARQGRSVEEASLEEMDSLWEQAKRSKG